MFSLQELKNAVLIPSIQGMVSDNAQSTNTGAQAVLIPSIQGMVSDTLGRFSLYFSATYK